jgi:predicted lipid-binding transport protein (Tim44 family)
MSIDIILFAIVAVVLIFRLRSVLGQKQDTDIQRPNPFAMPAPDAQNQDAPAAPSRSAADQDEEDVSVLPDRAAANPAVAALAARHAPNSLAGGIEDIMKRDPAFQEKIFLNGAKAAFPMIVEAFAKGDLGPIAFLLGEGVARNFGKAIEDRRQKQQTLETTIIKIMDADLTMAKVVGDMARVTVRFVSEQKIILKDNAGNLIDGSETQREEITDIWTFARDLSSKDPNWQLVETKA